MITEAIIEEMLTLEHIESMDKAALESLKRSIEATLKALPLLESLGLSLTGGSTRWRWDKDIVVERVNHPRLKPVGLPLTPPLQRS